jgi:hypothetical protein
MILTTLNFGASVILTFIFSRIGQCPPNVVKTYCEVTKVECNNASVYLAGLSAFSVRYISTVCTYLFEQYIF